MVWYTSLNPSDAEKVQPHKPNLDPLFAGLFYPEERLDFLKNVAALNPRAYRSTTQRGQNVVDGDAALGVALSITTAL